MVPPGGRSGPLKGGRFSRLGVFGGVLLVRERERRRRVMVIASQIHVTMERPA